MIALPHTGVVHHASEWIDAAGRRWRNCTIQPCGCTDGECWTVADIGIARHEGWNQVSVPCDPHGSRAALAHVEFALRLQTIEPRNVHGDPLTPQTRTLIARRAEILAAAAAVDAALAALGHAPARDFERGLAAGAIAAGVPAALPAAPKQKALAPAGVPCPGGRIDNHECSCAGMKP